MQFKKKKVVKYRGSKTHGCGSMKKRRGAGSRGGRGNAGSGKRGDANKQTFQNAGIKQGKFGFKSKAVKPLPSINFRELAKMIPSWEKSGKIVKKSDSYEINLGTLGFGKLLSLGNAPDKVIITINAASGKAVEKIEASGGKVILPSTD